MLKNNQNQITKHPFHSYICFLYSTLTITYLRNMWYLYLRDWLSSWLEQFPSYWTGYYQGPECKASRGLFSGWRKQTSRAYISEDSILLLRSIQYGQLQIFRNWCYLPMELEDRKSMCLKLMRSSETSIGSQLSFIFKIDKFNSSNFLPHILVSQYYLKTCDLAVLFPNVFIFTLKSLNI